MTIKKEISRTIVFASVFVGTLISEGISLVTIAEPGRRLGDKISQTVGNVGMDIQDRFHLTAARVIEESALINERIKRKRLVLLVKSMQQSFKEAYTTAKSKYDSRA